MKKNILKTLMALSVILTINNVIAAIPNHTFNYQGQLLDNGSPANGSYDITVTACASETAPSVYGKVSEHLNVSVTNGLFHLSNVDIVADNQNPFDGWDLYLEIAIKPSGTATYETLSPRQQLHAVPYANNLTMKGATDGQMLVFRETMQIGGSWEPMDNPWISNVNGIISNGDQVRLTRTADADLTSNSGALVIGNIFTYNIVLGNNEILARNDGAPATMYIGGKGGVITNGTNDNKGLLAIGDSIVGQMTFDGNDIQQIANGNPSTLFLNYYGGNVSIGSPINPAMTTIHGAFVNSSDKRLKKDIENLSYGLAEILVLKPKEYNWINSENEHKSFGLIAQDVQEVMQELVHTADDKEQSLSISYIELIPVLIKGMQEQQAIIEQQNMKIEKLIMLMENRK